MCECIDPRTAVPSVLYAHRTSLACHALAALGARRLQPCTADDGRGGDRDEPPRGATPTAHRAQSSGTERFRTVIGSGTRADKRRVRLLWYAATIGGRGSLSAQLDAFPHGLCES